MEKSWRIDKNSKVMEKLKNFKKFGQMKKDQNFKNVSMFQKDNPTI